MPGLFDRLRGKSDDEPLDMSAISPKPASVQGHRLARPDDGSRWPT